MPFGRVVHRVPWWGKIAAKLALTHLPISSSTWQRIGLFRHGDMDDTAYARGIFDAHRRNAGISDLRDRVVLELGPGNSVATAVLAATYGARAILVDAGDFASRDLDFYRQLASELHSEGLSAPDLADVATLEELLGACGATYITDGLRGLQRLPDSSVDLVFSQAVLEHVRRHEFESTQREIRRILRPSGLASHRVDLKDHLGGGLNNLRFSPKVWESETFVAAGFYTNRLSFSEMLAVFRATFPVVSVQDVTRWDGRPIRRRQLHATFRGRSDDDLLVSGFRIRVALTE
jgi:SAM-dependent methyltransferase